LIRDNIPPAIREIKLKSPKNGVKSVDVSTNGQNPATVRTFLHFIPYAKVLWTDIFSRWSSVFGECLAIRPRSCFQGISVKFAIHQEQSFQYLLLLFDFVHNSLGKFLAQNCFCHNFCDSLHF